MAPRAPVRRRRRAAPEGRPEAPEGRPEAGSGGLARHTPRRRPRGSRRRRERSVQCWGTNVFGLMLLCAKKRNFPSFCFRGHLCNFGSFFSTFAWESTVFYAAVAAAGGGKRKERGAMNAGRRISGKEDAIPSNSHSPTLHFRKKAP